MGKRPIYLDNHATTPVDPRVADAVVSTMVDNFGNASSTDHLYGDAARAAIETASAYVAELVGAEHGEVVFTSGATESSNLALQGLVQAARKSGITRKLRIGLMPVEHASVLDTCAFLQEEGLAELHFFPVDERAQLDLDNFRRVCSSGLDIVCLMAANNEVGTIYPLAAAADIARGFGSVVFSDATQAAGKIPLRDLARAVDLIAMSAHKMYGPKGVGCLVVRGGIRIQPIIHGGRHQRGFRSGTLNVSGIVGFGEAARLRRLEMHQDEIRVAEQRDRLQQLLLAQVPGAAIHGDLDSRLAGNLHLSIEDVPNAAMISRLKRDVAISTGAACSSGIEAPSHVLRAMALPAARLAGALRIGLGKFNTDEDVEEAARLIIKAAASCRTSLAAI